MSIDRTAFVASLTASLNDAASFFSQPLLETLADSALAYLHTVRPLRHTAEITLVAGQGEYPLPANCVRFISYSWWTGNRDHVQPEHVEIMRSLPRFKEAYSYGQRVLFTTPPPTDSHLSFAGNQCRIYYTAPRTWDDCDADDEAPLLARSLAECMRHLANRGAQSPVSVKPMVSGAYKQSTPAELMQLYLAEFKSYAR